MELKLGGLDVATFDKNLLIVPYGIETRMGILLRLVALPFNCTLWN